MIALLIILGIVVYLLIGSIYLGFQHGYTGTDTETEMFCTLLWPVCILLSIAEEIRGCFVMFGAWIRKKSERKKR